MTPTLTKAASSPVFGLLLIVASSFVIYGYSIWYPLARDQAIFAYVADRIMAGGLPYVDAWDFKSPGIYYIYSAAFAVFGHSQLAVRLLDMLAASGTSILIWHMFYRRGFGSAGVVSGVLYGALYGLTGYWCMAQTEGFAVFFLALAVNILLSDKWQSTSRLIPTGLAIGAAVIIKYPFAIASLGLLVFAVTSSMPSRRFRTGLMLVFSSALIPALATVYFAVNGALDDVLAASISFAGSYGKYPPRGITDIVFDFASAALSRRTVYDVLILPLAVAGLFVAPAGLKREQQAGRVWAIASLLAVIMQMKFLPYHWVAILAPASVLAGLLLIAAYETAADARMARVVVVSAVSLLLLRALSGAATEWAFLVTPASPGGVSPWLAKFSSEPEQGVSYSTDLAIVDYVTRNTSPDDTVLVLGFEPLINFLSERLAPTRFVYMDAVTAPWTPGKWRDEYVEDVRAKMPVLIVLAHNDTHIWKPKDSAAMLEGWPELQTLIKQHYRPAERISIFDIFSRAD